MWATCLNKPMSQHFQVVLLENMECLLRCAFCVSSLAMELAGWFITIGTLD